MFAFAQEVVSKASFDNFGYVNEPASYCLVLEMID